MRVTQAFLEGTGYTDVKIINVSKQDIKPCMGCYACWNKTPGKCIFEDSMNGILEKRIAADVIVWSFPLYWYNVPGELKNLIDRQLPMGLPVMAKNVDTGAHPSRYDLSKQRHVIISTCGFWTTENNYDSVTAMFNKFFRTSKKEFIYCAQGGIFGSQEAGNIVDGYLEIVKKTGVEFAKGGISEATQVLLSEPILPKNVYENAANASWGIELEKGYEITEKSQATPEDSLEFTKLMAASYVPDGKERVLEMHYTDIDKTFQIIMTAKGAQVVTAGFKQHTTRIETPFILWRDISNGRANGQTALFQRKYKVIGDFNLLMKFDELFGGTKPEKKVATSTSKTGQRKTNMKVLLLPWIVIWIAISINPTVGGVVGIVSVVAVSLFWLKYRAVVYEHLSIPIVAGVSLAVILGVDIRIVIPVSYFCFGLMWLISTFTKIPLTAHYSYNDHGGEELLENPIFMKVNRILTTCWGCLYLVMTVVMYFLMGTALLRFTGILSSAPPAILGIFTAWFPGWYMARWAKGDKN